MKSYCNFKEKNGHCSCKKPCSFQKEKAIDVGDYFPKTEYVKVCTRPDTGTRKYKETSKIDRCTHPEG